MSNPDSFIEEVNEEVRRDRLFHLLRRYGWIAILAILLIVGGAAWSEYRKAQQRAQAEALGDAILEALASETGQSEALAGIETEGALATAVLRFAIASRLVEEGDETGAAETLDSIALMPDIPEMYRQMAQFKSAVLQGERTPAEDRRQTLELLAQPGQPLRLLASEQLALIDIETGDRDAALTRYQAIVADAEVTRDLQQRARQVIVALGGELTFDDASDG
jgi:hypothetical protein